MLEQVDIQDRQSSLPLVIPEIDRQGPRWFDLSCLGNSKLKTRQGPRSGECQGPSKPGLTKTSGLHGKVLRAMKRMTFVVCSKSQHVLTRPRYGVHTAKFPGTSYRARQNQAPDRDGPARGRFRKGTCQLSPAACGDVATSRRVRRMCCVSAYRRRVAGAAITSCVSLIRGPASTKKKKDQDQHRSPAHRQLALVPFRRKQGFRTLGPGCGDECTVYTT
ncbi:hypothetical protein VUR80DRAFT_8494 [Thermomyces stellatus]